MVNSNPLKSCSKVLIGQKRLLLIWPSFQPTQKKQLDNALKSILVKLFYYRTNKPAFFKNIKKRETFAVGII